MHSFVPVSFLRSQGNIEWTFADCSPCRYSSWHFEVQSVLSSLISSLKGLRHYQWGVFPPRIFRRFEMLITGFFIPLSFPPSRSTPTVTGRYQKINLSPSSQPFSRSLACLQQTTLVTLFAQAELPTFSTANTVHTRFDNKVVDSRMPSGFTCGTACCFVRRRWFAPSGRSWVTRE